MAKIINALKIIFCVATLFFTSFSFTVFKSTDAIAGEAKREPAGGPSGGGTKSGGGAKSDG